MRSPTALLADEQHQDALALEFVGIDVKKSQLAPARPSAPSTTASARKTNRWGVGIDAPAAGARDFFPIGFAPTKPAREAIDVFHAFGATSLDELASSAQSKASFLGQVGMTLPSTHVLTIQAYTEVRRPKQTAAAPPTRAHTSPDRLLVLSTQRGPCACAGEPAVHGAQRHVPRGNTYGRAEAEALPRLPVPHGAGTCPHTHILRLAPLYITSLTHGPLHHC